MTARVQNDTGLPSFRFRKMGIGGEPFDIVVLRGTFELATGDRVVERAEMQDPISFADDYEGDAERSPLEATLVKDGDLVMFKPSTDVHVVGLATPPGGDAFTDWIATARVGAVEKRLRLLGPRRLVRTGDGWQPTEPEPVNGVRLDYRLAFGGAFTVPAHVVEAEQPEHLTKRDNPAGRGWHPDDEDLARVSEPARRWIEDRIRDVTELDAPQIEDPAESIRDPRQRAASQGFGPQARWWAPRIDHAGTFDERWRREIAPAFPEDFDARFYQSAHPDLVAPEWLVGGERITLEGLLEEGPTTMRLPGLVHVAQAKRASGAVVGGRMQLDTVSVDLDRRIVSLVWRGAFSAAEDPAVAILLEEVSGRLSNRGAAPPERTAETR